MATSHFEQVRFLTLEQVQEVFDLSLDSLGDFTNANGMLSPDIVKAVVNTHLWFRLQELFDTEDPTMLGATFDESNVRQIASSNLGQ